MLILSSSLFLLFAILHLICANQEKVILDMVESIRRLSSFTFLFSGLPNDRTFLFYRIFLLYIYILYITIWMEGSFILFCRGLYLDVLAAGCCFGDMGDSRRRNESNSIRKEAERKWIEGSGRKRKYYPSG